MNLTQNDPTFGRKFGRVFGRVFDAHTHVYPEKIADKASAALGSFYSMTINGKGTIEDLVANCQKAGVSGILLLGVATSAEQLTNVNRYLRTCVDYARSRSVEAYAFGGYHQDADPEAVLAQIVELGLSGVKIHPDIQRVSLDDPRIYRLCEIIEGRLPICFHMGDPREEYPYSRPEKLVRLLDRFPKLTVIASHLGGYTCWDRVADLYAGYENVWFDASSSVAFMPEEEAVRLIRTLGSDRVFFGTDYPIINQSQGIEIFDRLELTETERENILWNNIHRLLK